MNLKERRNNVFLFFGNYQSLITFLVGVMFSLVGILGFFITDILDVLGINSYHSFAQILSGLICFGAAFYSNGALASLYNRLFGVFFVVESTLSFIFPLSVAKYLNFGISEIIFTFAMGLILLICGFGGSYLKNYRKETFAKESNYFKIEPSWRFLNNRIHASLDYLVALLLVFVPLLGVFILDSKIGFYLPILLGISLFVYSLFTNYDYGIWTKLSYKYHMLIDTIAGLTLFVAPFLFDYASLFAGYFSILIGFVVIVLVIFSYPGDK